MQKVTVVASGQLATSALILSPFRGETTHAKPKTNLLLIDPIEEWDEGSFHLWGTPGSGGQHFVAIDPLRRNET